MQVSARPESPALANCGSDKVVEHKVRELSEIEIVVRRPPPGLCTDTTAAMYWQAAGPRHSFVFVRAFRFRYRGPLTCDQRNDQPG